MDAEQVYEALRELAERLAVDGVSEMADDLLGEVARLLVS